MTFGAAPSILVYTCDSSYPTPFTLLATNPAAMALPIIHINGYPGTGKLTIARKLVEVLSHCNAKLIHNHLLIDPVDAILPRSSPEYQPARRALRSVIFDAIAKSPDTKNSIHVFTDFQSNDFIGRGVMGEYINLAERHKSLLVPITLTCSKEENLRRLASYERGFHGKLTEPLVVEHLRNATEVYQWPEGQPLHLKLDVTELTVAEAVLAIVEHLGVNHCLPPPC
ncbi:hypothetical protein NW768_002755 [Fusarium equiseti]|uniref:Uncharacterized protein n=1 Tax=Fusarium equiseti TaxID=61235 RepID=A0ABQ8RJY7_FUSEQ|nr:hypothetical protein NW768_002755 [Fusarium equiseti]